MKFRVPLLFRYPNLDPRLQGSYVSARAVFDFKELGSQWRHQEWLRSLGMKTLRKKPK